MLYLSTAKVRDRNMLAETHGSLQRVSQEKTW